MQLSLETEPVALSLGLMSPPQVGELEFLEMEGYEAAAAPWDLLATPIGRGPFGHRKRYLSTPSFVLYRETFDSHLRVQGVTPAGLIGLSVPVLLGWHSSYWGKALHEQGLPASVGGALDAVIDAGQSHLIVLMTRELVQRHLMPTQAALLEVIAKTRLLPATRDKVDQLRGWLLATLEHAHRWPSMLRHPPALWVLEHDLMTRILAAIELPTTATTRPAPKLRHQALDRTLAFLRDAETLTLSLSELCTAARVSERTLEYAFRETYGAGPLEFVRRWRLHRARRALLYPTFRGGTVSEVAHGMGFWHLGRFAAEYRRLFGELPSDTLRRARTTEPGRALPG